MVCAAVSCLNAAASTCCSLPQVSGGDVSSKAMLPPRRTSKRQASKDVLGKTAAGKDQQQHIGEDLMEMSQQVRHGTGITCIITNNNLVR